MKTKNYVFLNEMYDPVRTLSEDQIKNIYGISNIDQYLLKNNKIDNYTVIEDEPCETVCFYETGKYRYYCNEDGKLIRKNKKNRKRIELKGYINRNELYVKIDNKSMSVAHIIINAFYTRLPRNYIVSYLDGDVTNCSLENMDVLSRSEYAKDIEHNPEKASRKNRKKIGLYINNRLIHRFQSVNETLQTLKISKRAFYKCIAGEGEYDLRYIRFKRSS